MKLILSLTLLLSFVTNSFASPLVFKITKEIKVLELTELGQVDTSKFRQIRVVIKLKDSTGVKYIPKRAAELNLRALKENSVEKAKRYRAQGVKTLDDVPPDEEKIAEAQKIYDYSLYPPVAIYGVEDNEEILLSEISSRSDSTFIIDSPPSKISIKAFGQGLYKVYIYGSK